VPSFANKIHYDPAFFAALKALQRQFCELATAQPTAKQDCQNRSVTLSRKSSGIGYLPERGRFTRCKPVA
jgi:hypothetical protein